MKAFQNGQVGRAALLGTLGLCAAFAAGAARVTGAAPPAASAVQASAQQPAHAQADDSASLRQGTVTALDPNGTRIQVQGVWIGMATGTTTLLRDGRTAGLDSLKVGETIRFIVATPAASTTSAAPGTATSAATSARVIYAP